jgi:hypothetical protein
MITAQKQKWFREYYFKKKCEKELQESYKDKDRDKKLFIQILLAVLRGGGIVRISPEKGIEVIAK